MSAALRPSPAASLAQPSTGGVLQRKCACGRNAGGLDQECESCEQRTGLGLPGRLSIGANDDPLEREADRAAGKVMGMTTRPDIRHGASATRLSRQARTVSAPAGRAPASVEQVLARTGEPLPNELRSFFEPRFGHDFGRVRLHADARAADSARAIDARAYTRGYDIAFGDGEFRPHTAEGKRLLAHELAHVVQHSGADDAMVRRAPCPDTCAQCPADGIVSEGCECIGNEHPESIVPSPVSLRIVSLSGGSSESIIKRDIAAANKTWKRAGIEVNATITTIDRESTEKILGTDERGRLQGEVEIEPENLALNSDSTRALLGLGTTSGNEKLSVAAGTSVLSAVVYYVPSFNRCASEKNAVGCAYSGSHGGRFFVLMEKSHQNAILAHELGHIWGNPHVANKQNLMFEAPDKRGIEPEQIRQARLNLGLGSLRCVTEEGTAEDRERIENEQQLGQLLMAWIEGEWSGKITIGDADRQSMIQFRVDPKNNHIAGSYWYETADRKQPGHILNGKVTAGHLDFDWEENRNDKSTKGKGRFSVSEIYSVPLRLAGTWGSGTSRDSGGIWTIEWTGKL
jgi:hypothetical protein